MPPPLPPDAPPARPPNWRVFGISMAVAAVFLFWVFRYATEKNATQVARRSAEAAPTRLEATEISWRSGSSRRRGHDVAYAFEADGQTFVGERLQWRDYDEGTDYKVCYDPADPADSMIYEPEVVCGGAD